MSASSRRLTAQTYADPRGWRNAGVAFRRVSGASDFSLVLAEASWLPRFSDVCSVTWSCRVGRYVVINQTRWRYASPVLERRAPEPARLPRTWWSTTRPATGSATATSAAQGRDGWRR